MFALHLHRLRPLCLLICLAAGPVVLLSGRQPQVARAPTPPRIVRLAPAEAARLAAEERRQMSVEMPAGLEVKVFAPEGLVADPIAIDLDEHGALYAISSSRASLPLDIRGHPAWVPIAHTLQTHEDLQKFYARELAPGRSAANAWIDDLNKDGSHDGRDLSEMKERLVRIQDTDGDGIADVSQVMTEGFNADPTYDVAGGLLYHRGDLFFGIAPGVWRMRDADGDGAIDTQTPISRGYNIHPAFGGHGISGITLGPDGRVYWEVGDIGFSVVDANGRRWAHPNQGAVFRANPDGSGFEVFAAGIRNLQEFAFDELGNLISVDNDGDHEGETERLVYLPEGSDSGWRANWQYGKYTDPDNNRYNVWMDESMFKPRFDGQAAYILPPIAPYHTGPSGMVFNPGTALSEEWRSHFFVSSFPGSADNARVYAFRLKAQGAGFALESDQVLLRGILTVGMKFGPDGALYLTDWITGWTAKGKGRIWKLDAPQAAATAMRKEVQSLIAADFSGRTPADLSALLRHADMRVRQKAQFELVDRGAADALVSAAGDRSHQLARVHALWGLGQLARKDARGGARLIPFLSDEDDEICAQAAKLLGDIRYAPAAGDLIPLLTHKAARARFFAAEALGRLAYKPATAPLVAMLAANDDQDVYLRHAGSLALSRIGDTAALAALSNHASRAVRMAAIIALRRMNRAEVARYLADQDEQLVTEAARAVNDDGGIAEGVPALARLLGEKRFTSEALLRRSINANLRSGTNAAVARLAAFAADGSRAEPLRVETIAVLGVFPKPSALDRVDGMYRGPAAPRASAAARTAILRLMRDDPASPALKIALADAAGRLDAQAAAPALRAQVRGDASAEVRIAALRALQALKVADMDDVMQGALADRDPGVRRAALTILPALPVTEAAKVQQLATVLKDGSIEDKQAGFAVLGALKSPAAEQLLASYLEKIGSGDVPPAVQLDLVDAAQSNGSAALAAQLESYRQAQPAGTLAAAFRDALLAGGSASRGRQTFGENPAAGCPRCHTIGTEGSDVGPNLTHIGTALSRDLLLQALMEPNARIAPGFGTVSVTLRSGERVDGTIREETASELLIVAGTPAAERRIAKAEIASRSNPVSAMPPMGQLLKLREIRDLVEFLGTLK
jgi:quinoprotein glucose dehydrogenase